MQFLKNFYYIFIHKLSKSKQTRQIDTYLVLLLSTLFFFMANYNIQEESELFFRLFGLYKFRGQQFFSLPPSSFFHSEDIKICIFYCNEQNDDDASASGNWSSAAEMWGKQYQKTTITIFILKLLTILGSSTDGVVSLVVDVILANDFGDFW